MSSNISMARSPAREAAGPEERYNKYNGGSSSAELSGSAASVAAVGVCHVFDNQHAIFDGLDLTITEGEFWTLLGPSGSGKTTLLRILAGLVSPSQGKVHIGGNDVTNLAVQHRNIGFVFQHYALFPHLTVAENIAFPLAVRGLAREESKQKVAQALELVELTSLGDRYPGQLSGGQQQRVAVARALVYDPKVLLLDEPLGALDQRLRQQLGADLRRIQQQTGTTAIYVTHDQNEAFLLSDVVVVMNEGKIHQMGRPVDVYSSPADSFVARFLGDTNILQGRIGEVSSASVALNINGVLVECSRQNQATVGTEGSCSLRPEDVEIYPVTDSGAIPAGRCVFGSAVVERTVFMGSRFRISMKIGEWQVLAERNRQSIEPQAGESWVVAWKHGAPIFIADNKYLAP